MQSHDVLAALRGLEELKVTAGTTDDQARAAMQVFTSLDSAMVGIVRFSGLTPWEWHPTDELLYILEGTVDVTVLAGETPEKVTVSAGSVVVVPAKAWHRQHAQGTVALLFVSSEGGVSRDEDPRTTA